MRKSRTPRTTLTIAVLLAVLALGAAAGCKPAPASKRQAISDAGRTYVPTSQPEASAAPTVSVEASAPTAEASAPLPAPGFRQGPSASVTPLSRPKGGLPIATKVKAPGYGAYLGVFNPQGPFDPGKIDQFESTVGKGASIVMWYQAWGGSKLFDEAAVVGVMRRGKIPMITWEPWVPGGATQPDYTLSLIANGHYDAYIRRWARQIRRLGGPVMLRPMHEMNGTWYPWSGTTNGNTSSLYIAAWRHMHDIFQQEGATNVTWVWSVNHHSVKDTYINRYAAYYPGSQYVDWTAISGFNFGTFRSYSHWQPFSTIYDDPLAYLRTLGKPIAVAEFGSLEKGGSKGDWYRDAYNRIKSDPNVAAVVVFNASDKRAWGVEDWRVNTTSSSLSGFRSAVSPSYFLAGRPPELSQWVGSLTKRDWQGLLDVAPIY